MKCFHLYVFFKTNVILASSSQICVLDRKAAFFFLGIKRRGDVERDSFHKLTKSLMDFTYLFFGIYNQHFFVIHTSGL